MSGGPTWAFDEPSTNSTTECTTDSGWTTTSIRSGGTPKSQCASITSSPLFIIVAESTEILAPIDQLGWATASPGVMAPNVAPSRSRNGPPEAVRISRSTAPAGSPTKHWNRAECSESTGTTTAPERAAAASTKAPATTSDSLLASATVRPASTAASVGASPAAPTMAATTTSASTAPSWRTASAPAWTSTPVPASASLRFW